MCCNIKNKLLGFVDPGFGSWEFVKYLALKFSSKFDRNTLEKFKYSSKGFIDTIRKLPMQQLQFGIYKCFTKRFFWIAEIIIVQFFAGWFK